MFEKKMKVYKDERAFFEAEIKALKEKIATKDEEEIPKEVVASAE
ncbi:MAG TPA: hypothetical protein VEJ36_03680 [Nitrososphaerales archaeon]|nr:hypothetical protein [Nitrososphaerales archaeon]